MTVYPPRSSSPWDITLKAYIDDTVESQIADLGPIGTAAAKDVGTASGDVPLLGAGGLLPIDRVATGSYTGAEFVRGDGTLATPAGTGGSGGSPTGAAGGDLAGSYPNPTIKTALNDPVAGTPGLRTLGTGPQQAAAGNDARLSDARTPTTHTHTKSQVTDLGTIGTAAALNIPASGNAAAGEVVKGSDTRLTDSRTPTAHGHAQTDITNLVADLAAKAPVANPTFTGTVGATMGAGGVGTGTFRDSVDARADAKIAAKSQSGVVATGTLVAGTDKNVTVTFSPAFAVPPVVVGVIQNGTSGASGFALTTSSPTTTGVVFNVYRETGTTGLSIHWIAMVPTQ
jgi:hypothetical protein